MNENIHMTMDADGVMSVHFDTPDKTVNTLSPDALDELDRILTWIESGEYNPVAILFVSAKSDSFITGADLYAMSRMDQPMMQSFLEHGQALFDRVARLPMPTVAVINGHCLGGGFELSLACTWRVAADVGSINLGLPEVKLGILPGWGGTTRVTRMIGPMRALPLLLAGKTLPPRKAQRLGLIDEVVRPEALSSAAHRLARKTRPQQPRPTFIQRVMMRTPGLLNRIAEKARAQTREKTCGNYPAADKIIDVVVTVARYGHAPGLQAERNAVMQLVETDACRNLMRLFFLRQDAKRSIRSMTGEHAAHMDQVAVIGGGAMGAGIVHALADAGVRVRLIDVTPDAISAALNRIARLVETDQRGKRISPLQAKQIMQRIHPTTQWTGLGLMDMAIEAVAERMDVKCEVIGRLDRLLRADAVIASNTSSLSLTEMTQAAGDPTRVIGLHFFNPVNKMPLVEVVRTAASSNRALSLGAELALRIGKTPVLVAEGPGFLINRLLIPYLAEALTMASQGADIVAIDIAMKRWGMPMGPFELLDQVGLDIAVHILRAMSGPFGERIITPPRLDDVIERGWLGRKSKIGFYNYQGGRGRPPINESMLKMIRQDDAKAPHHDESSIQWRLLSPMINQTMRVLETGIVDSTDTIDLATVLGLGLAPFRGGLARFIDTVGLPVIVGRMEALASAHGPRFAPVDSLRQLAESHQALAEYERAQSQSAQPRISRIARTP